MTKELVPAVRKAALPYMKFTEKNEPTAAAVPFSKKTKEEARAYWQEQLNKTTEDVLALEGQWTKHCHDLVKGDLYARKRHLKWLGGYWTRRLASERKAVSRISSGDNAYDGKLREAVNAYYAEIGKYVEAGWVVGMKAIEDKTMIDEPKLKAGIDGFKAGGKALRKARKRLKLPKA